MAITEHLSLLAALGHCQKRIICFNLLIDIHQHQSDEDDSEYIMTMNTIAALPGATVTGGLQSLHRIMCLSSRPAQSTIDCTLLIRVVCTKFARPTIVCRTYNKSVPSMIHRVIWQNLLLPGLYRVLTINLSFTILYEKM